MGLVPTLGDLKGRPYAFLYSQIIPEKKETYNKNIAATFFEKETACLCELVCVQTFVFTQIGEKDKNYYALGKIFRFVKKFVTTQVFLL